ncbi:MAG: 4'-phosphopantetheinyl transferase superfamily protein [Parasporobacterium sp.]|nr:4'-phosphopantetheinyl transferase superfamily protein [Parasporobacterium sp.]
MIFGIGTDTFDINRFLNMAKDKIGFDSFLKHSYTENEKCLSFADFKKGLLYKNAGFEDVILKDLPDIDDKMLSLACLFCAKEAVFKSLNLSSNTLFHWKDIEILPSDFACYTVNLSGLLKEHADKVKIKSVKVDISIDDNMILSGAVTEI